MDFYIFIVENKEQNSSSKEHDENKKVNKKYPVVINTIDKNSKKYLNSIKLFEFYINVSILKRTKINRLDGINNHKASVYFIQIGNK
jgi:tRNA U34 5-carboxymethylaminomethyl modifying GTPase MnmE/TrmE